MLERLSNAITQYPYGMIALVIFITIFSVMSMGYFGLKQEFSEETFMPSLDIVKANREITWIPAKIRSVKNHRKRTAGSANRWGVGNF